MLHTIKEYRKDVTVTAAKNLVESSVIENSAVTDPKEQLATHMAVLKIYAGRVLDDNERLLPWEEIDKAARIIEIFVLGSSFECTHRDLVKVLYRDLFKAANR